MDIIISARHMSHLSQKMKSEVEGRLNRISQKYGKLTKSEVVLDKVKERYSAEIVMHGKGINIDAKSSDSDNLYDAIHQAADRLEKQLDKKAGKMKKHNSKHLGDLELDLLVDVEDEFEYDEAAAF